ncbi:MAG: DUF72 domain-containing protein [bacterium]|nr:DUF72 domain-containing protein [bacterium]
MVKEPAPTRAKIHIGTSSFSEKDWVGSFYPLGTPQTEFLSVYAQHFSTVEIDSTYYGIPSARTVDNWAARTPETFLFALKFPRSIVHGGEAARPDAKKILVPALTYPVRDRFLEVAGRLGARLGPLVLQFPYFSKDVYPDARWFYDRLEQFLRDLPQEYRYGVEIRNKDWLKPELADLFRTYHAAVVLSDYMYMPLAEEIEKYLSPATTDFGYVRLIGNRKEIEAVTMQWNREVIDRSSRLDRWADFLNHLAQQVDNIYVYVNNHYAGYAPGTVRRLQERITGASSI